MANAQSPTSTSECARGHKRRAVEAFQIWEQEVEEREIALKANLEVLERAAPARCDGAGGRQRL